MQTPEDIRDVLARAMRSGEQVAIHVTLQSGGTLRASGALRAVDDRWLEIHEGQRVRRLPLSRVVEARTVPPRRPVEPRPESGASES